MDEQFINLTEEKEKGIERLAKIGEIASANDVRKLAGEKEIKHPTMKTDEADQMTTLEKSLKFFGLKIVKGKVERC